MKSDKRQIETYQAINTIVLLFFQKQSFKYMKLKKRKK